MEADGGFLGTVVTAASEPFVWLPALSVGLIARYWWRLMVMGFHVGLALQVLSALPARYYATCCLNRLYARCCVEPLGFWPVFFETIPPRAIVFGVAAVIGFVAEEALRSLQHRGE